MNSDSLNIILAILPILSVLYLMIGRNWGGSQAGPAGWLLAVAIAVIFFGANGVLLLVATGKALLLAVYVLYIIWMALLLYNVVNDAGAIDVIGTQLPKLAEDKAAQALLLAWVFGSFLQGASGFGVPAAVVAPLLVGLGFRPTVAVAVALLGHAWAITFGSLGSSFFALEAASGVPGEVLAGPAAIYMGVCCLLCGMFVLVTADGRQALARQGVTVLVLTAVMGSVQYWIAAIGLWSLAAFGAGLVGLIVMVVALRWRSRSETADPLDTGLLLRAFVPYLILTVVIVVGQLVLKPILDVIVINWAFPAVETASGYATAAGTGRSISLFGHPGALLLYSSLIAYGVFKFRGTLGSRTAEYQLWSIVVKTAQKSRKSTISIIALVAMATTMQHAGMTQLLAEVLSGTGRMFPVLSPFIGALGAFMTGSNTNSNVVFGDLQYQTALALQLTPAVVLAAQTVGGAVGSIFAPAKVVVGCSTVEGADDGTVLKLATGYGLAITAIFGLLTFLILR